MLPASRTSTSKMMRAAVENADAIVQARHGVQFPSGQKPADKLNGLNAWCKVTVLRLNSCGLGEGGGGALAKTLRLNATVTSLNLGANDQGEGRGCVLAGTLRLNASSRRSTFARMTWKRAEGRLAEAVRLNTTVASLELYADDLGEGGGRALAETLRLNTTLKSLFLSSNFLGEGGGRSLAETLRLNTSLTELYLGSNALGEG